MAGLLYSLLHSPSFLVPPRKLLAQAKVETAHIQIEAIELLPTRDVKLGFVSFPGAEAPLWGMVDAHGVPVLTEENMQACLSGKMTFFQ